jgi:hypothetical protein
MLNSPQQSANNYPYGFAFNRTMWVNGNCFCAFPANLSYAYASGHAPGMVMGVMDDGSTEERSMRTIDPSELGIGGPMSQAEVSDRYFQKILPGLGYELYGRVKYDTGPLIDPNQGWIGNLKGFSGGLIDPTPGIQIINMLGAGAGQQLNTMDKLASGDYEGASRGYVLFNLSAGVSTFREWDNVTPTLELFGLDPYGDINEYLAGFDRPAVERGITGGPGQARVLEIAAAAVVGAVETRGSALGSAKERAGVPRSQQPTRQWRIGDPKDMKGPGVRDPNVRNQGIIYEYEIPKAEGGTEKVYIIDHTKDALHGGIGHVHTGKPPGQAKCIQPGGRYTEVGEPIPYGKR